MFMANVFQRFKKYFALVVAVLFFTASAQAQRIAYIDLGKILESIDEYQAAQEQLDQLAARWQQEIAQEYDKIKSMYNRYQAEQVLLSDDARRQKEEEILQKEKAVRDMQKAKFGPEGDLFKRRQELVQPIQERVYREIEEYAKERGYDFVFDRSGSAGIIFSNPSFDKTEDIIRRMQ